MGRQQVGKALSCFPAASDCAQYAQSREILDFCKAGAVGLAFYAMFVEIIWLASCLVYSFWNSAARLPNKKRGPGPALAARSFGL